MEEINVFVENVRKDSCKRLETEKRLLPAAFVLTPDGTLAVVLDFSDRATKRSSLAALALMAKSAGAKAIVVAVDAFVSVNPQYDKQGNPLHRPSEDPQRKEAIAIMVFTSEAHYTENVFYTRGTKQEILWEDTHLPKSGDFDWIGSGFEYLAELFPLKKAVN